MEIRTKSTCEYYQEKKDDQDEWMIKDILKQIQKLWKLGNGDVLRYEEVNSGVKRCFMAKDNELN